MFERQRCSGFDIVDACLHYEVGLGIPAPIPDKLSEVSAAIQYLVVRATGRCTSITWLSE